MRQFRRREDAALEYYGYDGQDLLFDISDPDGSGTTFSPAIKRRYLHGPAIDQILAQETVGGETLWMLTDHQGSVRDLVRNDGTIAAHYQYDSFGKPLGLAGGGVFASPLFFEAAHTMLTLPRLASRVENSHDDLVATRITVAVFVERVRSTACVV